MEPDILEKSICTTCYKLKKCTLIKSKTEPVIFCEEYDESLTVDIPKLVNDLIQRHNGHLVSVLENIQSTYNYLPEDIIREVGKQMTIPMRDVYGVATFYKAFSLKPRGAHLCSVCLGTACHVRGGHAVVEEFERQLGIKPSETTKDKEFTLETVNCLGACAIGPIVVVDGEYSSNVKTIQVKKIIKNTLEGGEKIDITQDKRIFPVQINCPRCNHTLMDKEHFIDGYPSVRVTISFLGKHGWFRLSSLYGSYNVESEYERPVGLIANYFCPHCHTEMTGTISCPICCTQMISMIVATGGVVHVCPKRGCKGHILDVG